MGGRKTLTAAGVVTGTILTMAVPVLAGNAGAQVGLDNLIARIGLRNTPTGAGVRVAQVEAVDGQGDYSPDQNHAEFNGKTFFLQSGATGTSNHATSVGRRYYGNTDSIAPGVTEIFLYEAGDWVLDFLGVSPPGTPDPAPLNLRVLNNSWVGALGALDNTALRKADFFAQRDNVLLVNGVNNSGTSPALMFAAYNGLAVGRANGNHATNNTPGNIDGVGRMKPEIVAPGDFTSYAAPVIDAGAALMFETASKMPDGVNAMRAEVIKAVILAGTNHRPGSPHNWSNNPDTVGPNRGVTDQPLDNVLGADLLDVNFAHLILTAGEQEGDTEPPSESNISYAGWDLATMALDESRYYRFPVTATADEVSIIATWYREIPTNFGQSWSPDIDLILWRVDEGGDLVTLVGDPGLPYFADGNVVSESALDNIEHLFIQGLEPGEYVLEARRLDFFSQHSGDIVVAWLMPEQEVVVIGDLDGDGTVGPSDLAILLGSWGPCPGCPADINGDGVVGPGDLAILLGNWA